ncbi:hypothetical protein [Flavobacterium davisii]|uniref:hypothetical protein n=1 Tax=Flavobacterium davisii TaxID=2906077 RepID=UPI0035CF60C0
MSIFIISLIGFTYWFFSDHTIEINLKNIFKASLQVGLIGAILPTLTFLMIYFLINKIKNIITLTLSIIALIVFAIILFYWFFITMLFYDINGNEWFIESFRF